ncbi:hypothetical protein CMV30_10840 [Nibricoccus aquaticus]|uniref:Ice-binding protein C-terminal domain-containing protein n=1 Tax=Nibricoccus aquaticus TaxID=2576891 RepID=A0A290QKL6_9BACT|nr:PEP-CTERM sorting domain-containing protein [Nibricoccus aquaticus]ATC64412.1 hypothetical protein CMV30_10840 [Nibricoccus aquaticus]
MKTRIHLLAVGLTAFALTATAQIIPDPVGVNTFTQASAFNTASYAATFGNAPGGMGLYFASQAFAPSATVSSWNFVTQNSDIAPSIPWLAGGGTVKTIFLGESAGANNDFGFIRSGTSISTSSNYIPLATNIVNTNTPGGTIQSGWETLANYGAGERLDFWLNNPGTFDGGGAYFAFLENSVGAAFAGGDPYTHSKYSWTNVLTEYVDTNGATVRGNVATLLIAFEDLRGPALAPGAALPTIAPGDGDYTDFIVGFQFLPTQPSMVPEPSTYGLIAALGLMAVIARRRFNQSRQIKA